MQKIATLGLNDLGQIQTSTTLYLGGYQYNNDILQFFPHGQGYVKHNINPNTNASEFDYVYQYKDHLGNIRINYTFDALTSSLKVLEENHYYPFGLKHTESLTRKDILFEKEEQSEEWEKKVSSPPIIVQNEIVPNSGYQYKYNGKEWQDELGLNVTAMDFRMYDNALGRFNAIDAVADIMPGWSPYRFGFNNPVIWKDPSGLLENDGGDEDDCKCGVQQMDEIVITAKGNGKSVHDTGMPYNHSYWMMPKSYNAMTFEDYNNKHLTNYKTFDQWYYHEKYLPFKMEMIRDIQSAQFKAGMAVMALVGSVAAAPILAASPVVTSVLSNPLVQQGALNISLNAGSQYLANGGKAGDINIIEAGLSGVPGTNLIPTIAGETFSLTTNDGFQPPTFDLKWAVQVGGGILSNRLERQPILI